MDSVSHPTNIVMETGSALMAVMKSTAVSSEGLLASFLHIFFGVLLQLAISRDVPTGISAYQFLWCRTMFELSVEV